jgi:hypothetical protein
MRAHVDVTAGSHTQLLLIFVLDMVMDYAALAAAQLCCAKSCA